MEITINGIEVSNGKKVILFAPADFDAVDQLADVLRTKFPECEWAVLEGGFTAVVLESDPDER